MQVMYMEQWINATLIIIKQSVPIYLSINILRLLIWIMLIFSMSISQPKLHVGFDHIESLRIYDTSGCGGHYKLESLIGPMTPRK